MKTNVKEKGFYEEISEVPEMDFFEELMSNAKHDDAGSRLKAASMIMEKCGDKEMSDVLDLLSAQMAFDDNEEACPAIGRTLKKLDSMIRERDKHWARSYIKRLRDSEILELSNGEVLAEDYDYLTSSFYKYGLFDPDIFGGSGKIPLYDDENDDYRLKSFGLGIGHIMCPVHVILKEDYSDIAHILGMKNEDVERVARYASYLVMDPGKTSFKKFDVIREQEYAENKEGTGLVVEIGGDAIYNALVSLGYPDEPERLAFSVVPVVSPVVRPMAYSKEEDSFYSFPLNNLYNLVILEANRCRKLAELGAPDIIMRNERRMLDERVNKLVDHAHKLFRNTDWNRVCTKTRDFIYVHVKLLMRSRPFGLRRLPDDELNKTDKIESLHLFPETVTLCNGDIENPVNLVDVIDHNDSILNEFRMNNGVAINVGPDVPEDEIDDHLDDETKEEIRVIDETYARMVGYGNDIISEAKAKREACRVIYDEDERMYRLAS